MANQASEELREIFINRMWNYFGIEDKSELAHFGTIYDQAVAPIIRTEKLKLLAEVREEALSGGLSFELDDGQIVIEVETDLKSITTKLEAEL